jgi:tetratricopeptide (TPR) repeat protein
VPVALLGQGIARYQRGNAAGAAEAFGEALRLARAAEPPRPRMVQRTAAALGTALLALGRADEAEPLLREAVALEQAEAASPEPAAVPSSTNGEYERRELAGAALRARWAAAAERLGRPPR